MPSRWNELWDMLPDKRLVGERWDPPMPLILAAWWETSDDEKRARLELHVRWAASSGALSEVERFLRSLLESDWNHRSE